MKKTLSILAVALALLAILFLRTRSTPDTVAPAGGEEAAEPSRTPDELVRPEREQRTQEVVETGRRAAPEAAPPADDPEPAAEAVDHQEQRLLRIRAIDRFGTPVVGVAVHAIGIRTVEHPGDWMGYPGSPPEGETDREGRVALEVPAWMGGLGESWLQVRKLILTAEHTDYVPTNAELPLVDEEQVLTLRRGALLIVSGWIHDEGEVITDVRAELCYDVGVSDADWLPLRDGRRSCNRVPPGTHSIRLAADRDGVRYTSAGEQFELAEEEQKELHLHLLAPRRLEGVLDPAVPRPVANGDVRVAVQFLAGEGSPGLLRTYDAHVAPDGTFALPALPVGTTEIIGLCDGWVSRREATAEDPDELGAQLVPDALDGPFVLAMEPTATVDFTVLDPDGAPLQGARIDMWPNVFWRSRFSNIFLDRRWSTLTDAEGHARLENLPAFAGGDVLVRKEGFLLPLAESGRRYAPATLVAGEPTRLEVRMEKGEE